MTLISYSSKGLKTLPIIPTYPPISSLDLSNNELQNFEGMDDSFQSLETLNLDNNSINSFIGAITLPNLKNLTMRNSPICKEPNLDLMCLIVFGNSLTKINGNTVSQSEKDKADLIRNSIKEKLLEGYLLIDSMNGKMVRDSETIIIPFVKASNHNQESRIRTEMLDIPRENMFSEPLEFLAATWDPLDAIQDWSPEFKNIILQTRKSYKPTLPSDENSVKADEVQFPEEIIEEEEEDLSL